MQHNQYCAVCPGAAASQEGLLLPSRPAVPAFATVPHPLVHIGSPAPQVADAACHGALSAHSSLQLEIVLLLWCSITRYCLSMLSIMAMMSTKICGLESTS